MKTDLFIAELLCVIIGVVATILAYQFYLHRNGILRKLMIFHWVCQAWAVTFSGAWFWMDAKGTAPTDLGTGRILTLVPLGISMVLFLAYVVNQNRANRAKYNSDK